MHALLGTLVFLCLARREEHDPMSNSPQIDLARQRFVDQGVRTGQAGLRYNQFQSRHERDPSASHRPP